MAAAGLVKLALRNLSRNGTRNLTVFIIVFLAVFLLFVTTGIARYCGDSWQNYFASTFFGEYQISAFPGKRAGLYGARTRPAGKPDSAVVRGFSRESGLRGFTPAFNRRDHLRLRKTGFRAESVSAAHRNRYRRGSDAPAEPGFQGWNVES